MIILSAVGELNITNGLSEVADMTGKVKNVLF